MPPQWVLNLNREFFKTLTCLGDFGQNTTRVGNVRIQVFMPESEF